MTSILYCLRSPVNPSALLVPWSMVYRTGFGDTEVYHAAKEFKLASRIRTERMAKQKEEDKLLRCPYCSSGFPDKEELSRHIDRIHLGSGLLEGDARKW